MHQYTPVAEPDLPEVFRIMRLAFTGEEPGQRRWLATMGIDNLRAMRADRDAPPEAVVSLVRMAQHFGGRAVPMTGIVGVAVAPECRGTGLAQQMMEHAVREAREVGTPISTLYASTQSLYRKSGYEQAGSRFRITIRPDQIGVRERDLQIRIITDDDANAVMACARAFASHYDGPLVRDANRGWDAYCWHRIRENRDTKYAGFAVANPDDSSKIDGYLFMHQGRSPYRGRQNIALSDLAFTTPSAGRRLLSFLADYAMIADEVSFFGSPTHPIISLMPMQKYHIEHFDYWMTRITDLPGALEARGYLPGVRASISLDITDAIIPENAGVWRVDIEGGSARVTKGSGGGRSGSDVAMIRCDIRALAALYTGFTTPAQARLLGWIMGDDEAIRAASSIFTASTPWMSDMF